jgi:uncharacterized membrane protein YphA (DoxX/SURF4 family)
LSVALTSRPGRALVVTLRLAVAAVFLWAAVPKILDPAVFAEAIANYHVVPDAWIGPIAVVLPFVELAAALGLIAGVHEKGSAVCASVLLAGFTIAMGQAMARGIDIDCGCFGSAQTTTIGAGSLLRNVALMGACAVIVAGPRVPWVRRSPTPVESA